MYERVRCPNCRGEMEVSLAYEPADPSVGIFHDGYELTVEDQDCDCELTAAQQSILAQNIVNDVQESIGADMADRYARGYDDL
jgi:hypothetical protein